MDRMEHPRLYLQFRAAASRAATNLLSPPDDNNDNSRYSGSVGHYNDAAASPAHQLSVVIAEPVSRIGEFWLFGAKEMAHALGAQLEFGNLGVSLSDASEAARDPETKPPR